MKTLLLDCPPVCDFTLLGLVSSSRDYRVAWALNQTLGWHLVRQPDYSLPPDRAGAALTITQFRYPTPHGTVRLLTNKLALPTGRSRPFLLPELASFDFLLVLEGALTELSDPATWASRLRGVPLVQYVCPFDPSQLRGWEALVSP